MAQLVERMGHNCRISLIPGSNPTRYSSFNVITHIFWSKFQFKTTFESLYIIAGQKAVNLTALKVKGQKISCLGHAGTDP